MSKIFLFYILTLITRNPFFSLLVILALYFLIDRRFIGLLPDFSRPLRLRREMARLRREVMLNPHNAEALSNLGRDLVGMKRYRDGVAHLERALEKMSEIAETRYYLGLGYLRLREFDRAEAHLKAAIALDPRYGYGEAYLRLGDLHALRGEVDAALQAYESFTGIHTSSSEGFFKMGELWLQRGDAPRARAFYQEALQAFRGSPPHKKRIDRSWFWKARMALLRQPRPAG
jgi:tetratricopeptide (TPR) repeat protein